MGIAADGNNKAFPSADVDAFLDRPRAQIPIDIVEELSRYNTRHFVLAGSSGTLSILPIHILTRCLCVRSGPERRWRLRVCGLFYGTDSYGTDHCAPLALPSLSRGNG